MLLMLLQLDYFPYLSKFTEVSFGIPRICATVDSRGKA